MGGGNNVVWDEFLSLNNTATEISTLLESTKDEIGLLQKSTSCQIYTPIYVQLMHQDICTNAANNILVLFLTTLFLTLFVMIMLTLRVALLQEPVDGAYTLRCNNEDDEAVSLIRDNIDDGDDDDDVNQLHVGEEDNTYTNSTIIDSNDSNNNNDNNSYEVNNNKQQQQKQQEGFDSKSKSSSSSSSMQISVNGMKIDINSVV